MPLHPFLRCICLIFGFGSVFLDLGCSPAEASRKATADTFATVTRGSISREIRVVGPIRSDDSLEIYSEVQGKVQKIYAERGQLIKPGDKILSIEAVDAEMELKEAQLQEQIARNELETERAKADNAAVTRKRELELELAKLKVEKAQRQLSRYDVVAMQSGKIGWLSVKVGDFVTGKGPYNPGTKIADIVGPNVYKVKIVVGERDVSMIRVRQVVRVKIDAVPGLTTEGEVVDIQTVSDQNSGSPSFPITIKFSSISPEIKLGMTASVGITLAESKGCLLVPVQALRIANDQAYVVTLDEKLGRHESSVTVGLDDGQLVEVKGQLSENQKVVLF